MIIASAQTRPFECDIQANIEDHLKQIKIAAEKGARLIAFPEMSLTGYMRENAAEFALTPEAPELLPLKHAAQEMNIVVIAGAPLVVDGTFYIGSFIFTPGGKTLVYTKQYLHPGEEVAFESTFSYNPILELDGEKIVFAICADIDHPEHPCSASENGGTIYIPSIFFSKNGIPDAYQKLGYYAKTFSLNILMSNFCGECWGTEAGGRSAFWSNKGELIASLDDKNHGLLLIESSPNE
jgi:predicted amidohydrolase